jgi:hypothetical protein
VVFKRFVCYVYAVHNKLTEEMYTVHKTP